MFKYQKLDIEKNQIMLLTLKQLMDNLINYFKAKIHCKV
jgi:hypothetical protein